MESGQNILIDVLPNGFDSITKSDAEVFFRDGSGLMCAMFGLIAFLH